MAEYSWINFQELLEQKKEDAQYEFKSKCESKIIEGFNQEIHEVLYHFSYDKEAQLNFNDTSRLMDKGLIDEIGWSVRTTKDEIVRIILGREEFDLVFLAGVMHKNRCLDYYRNAIIPKIKDARTKNELELINWELT